MEVVTRLEGVGVTVGGHAILDGVDLVIGGGRHLAVLGPNGAGKTTLLRLLATYRHPSQGRAEVLGVRFGRGDLRDIRPRIGLVSIALDDLERSRARVDAIVAAAHHGSIWPTRDLLTGDAALAAKVESALARLGIEALGDRRLDTLSQGERQRVRIARALSLGPRLLLLDEPFAGLDLGGRETLLADLDGLLADPDAPTVVMVTHHLEELPVGIVDALLLRDGRPVATGPVGEVLRDDPISATFGLPVEVRQVHGRYAAVARRGQVRGRTPR
jgi:iron complex transport system ATP-binding protein